MKTSSRIHSAFAQPDISWSRKKSVMSEAGQKRAQARAFGGRGAYETRSRGGKLGAVCTAHLHQGLPVGDRIRRATDQLLQLLCPLSARQIGQSLEYAFATASARLLTPTLR